LLYEGLSQAARIFCCNRRNRDDFPAWTARELTRISKDPTTMKTASIIVLYTALCCLVGCASPTDKPQLASTSAAGAAVGGEQPGQASAMEPQAPDLDPVICKKITPTGSRIPQRHCMRRSSWLGLEKKARDNSDEIGQSREQMQGPDGG